MIHRYVFHTDLLKLLKVEFEKSSTKNILLKNDFISVTSKNIGLDLTNKIYKQIDVNNHGYITLSEFMKFVFDYDTMNRLCCKSYQPHMKQMLSQSQNTSYGHQDLIDCLTYASYPRHILFSAGRDGNIYSWSPADLTPISIIENINKCNSLVQEIHKKVKSTPERSKMKVAESLHKLEYSNDKVQITSLHKMISSSHLCIGYADSSIVFYELNTKVSHF
jgi:WD40 repeat protein